LLGLIKSKLKHFLAVVMKLLKAFNLSESVNTVVFSGRLGNNMFQLANLIAYSIKNNSQWALPVTSRDWQRGQLTIIPLKLELFAFNYKVKTVIDNRVFLNFHSNNFNYSRHPKYLKYFNVSFDGHFQSYKYFDHIKFDLQNLYFAPNPVLKEYLINFEVIEKSVGIHVRRGDYLELKDFHQILDMNYFKKSIDLMERSIGQLLKIYIFSDDLEWCIENFKDSRCIFHEGNSETDFFLMTKMKNLIISNSSFSWWAAYLNCNNGIIHYPKHWFGPKNVHLETSDLFLPNWIEVDNLS
jgi:hypothetical protein